ncbi:S8 family serine peptidase (plasmid) [Edwardsiella tarda]|uniref:S8 family serine peptidase n=1 Tax=Edwardsiella tarda TaxID=636 RepID=UPI0024451680|nr:S8 family serine peptidase [Edwardsiella tarda]WGE31139.1 S8 family serine peptidase [Edwardsiella tarda]
MTPHSFKLSRELLTSSAYQSQWHLHGRTAYGRHCRSVNAEQAWCRLNGFGREDIVIAFADDGCQMDAVASGVDDKFVAAAYMEQDRLIYAAPQQIKAQMFIPGHRHGTALAGLIAGAVNAYLPVGVAPGCSLLPVRWEYDRRFHITPQGFHTILKALEDKTDIFINTWASLPHMIFPDQTINLIRELSRSGGRRGKGILFIWAAGNSGCPIHFHADSPVPYAGYVKNNIFCDGKYSAEFTHSLYGIENVLTVAAINLYGRRAHYSCYGPGIALCAPSNNRHCFDAFPFNEPGLTTRSADIGGYTRNFKGTSGAAGLVAGVAALTLSANPQLNACELADILRRTAAKDLDFRPYMEHRYPAPDFGAGEVTDLPLAPFHTGGFNSSGWSPWFGYGLVDAEQAVIAALKR